MLESLRKDVECTFGILKGRFWILITPIRFHNSTVLDNTFLTCYILHNVLLKEDEVASAWEGGVKFLRVDGMHEREDVPRVCANAQERLSLDTDCSTIGNIINLEAVNTDHEAEFEQSHNI